MPKPTQAEIDIALHQYGQRMRAAWDAKQTAFEKNIAAFRDGVREEWDRERMKVSEPRTEPPVIEAPKIGPPDKSKGERQPDEPDMGR
ncbi:MAG: hypothetical protein V4773_16470 [Verrucomicrobiota bacterium]